MFRPIRINQPYFKEEKMKTKLLMTILSASLLLLSGGTVFAATETLGAPSADLGSTVTASAPFSKSVTGRYTGGAGGVSYEAGVTHISGTREFGTGSSYTSVYRKDCPTVSGTISCAGFATTATTAGTSVAIDFSAAATWTAQ